MNVAEYYVSVLKARRQIEVAENRATSLAAHARDVQGMFDAGLRPKTDLLSAQVALADARQQVFRAQNALETAQAYYNRILGRPLTDPVHLAELANANVPGDVEELSRQAMQSRPEIAQLSAQTCVLREQAAATEGTKRATGAPSVTSSRCRLLRQSARCDRSWGAKTLCLSM